MPSGEQAQDAVLGGTPGRAPGGPSGPDGDVLAGEPHGAGVAPEALRAFEGVGSQEGVAPGGVVPGGVVQDRVEPDAVASDAASETARDGDALAGIDPLFGDRMFREARTAYEWSERPVPEALIRELYGLASLGPTSGNCCPARFVFLRSPQAKEKLRPLVSPGNADRVVRAPVVAIVAFDPFFYEQLPVLCREPDARDWFAENHELADATARRNTTLQGAWLIMAARALGLACGPMSGFDNARVDEAFLAEHGWRSDFLVCLGFADRSGTGARGRRLGFDEVCRTL